MLGNNPGPWEQLCTVLFFWEVPGLVWLRPASILQGQASANCRSQHRAQAFFRVLRVPALHWKIRETNQPTKKATGATGRVLQTSKALSCFGAQIKETRSRKGWLYRSDVSCSRNREQLKSSKGRRGKCLHLQMMCVSLCGCECIHAHAGEKTFQENHRISTTRLQGKEMPRSLN